MIPIQLPDLKDIALFPVLRRIALLAMQITDILGFGLAANRPTGSKNIFYWATDTKVLSFYTSDATLGGGTGWITITYT